MKVKQISVQNLFGLFNHTVPLNLPDRMTIIHGPNGYGKTILLKMVDGLFKKNYSIFRRIPFETFRIDFDDGKSISVKQSSTKGQHEKVRVTISSLHSEDKPLVIESSETKQPPFPVSAIEDIISELTRVGSAEWLDQRTGQVLSLDDVRDKYGDSLPFPIENRQTPKWLKDIQNEVVTHFVQTNRLLSPQTLNKRATRHFERDSFPTSVSSVTEYSRELADRLQKTLAASAELSQSLDRSFPKRLVDQLSTPRQSRLSTEKLRNELRSLEEKRSNLMSAGLMDKSDSDVQIPEGVEVADLARIVLSIYAKDVEKKLKVYDEILAKISLLQRIINARYSYSFKSLRVDKSRGFVFETKSGTTLSAEALSSGEQHELVLFYELLFKVQPNSLILIDEPEISLHIAWQQEFLKDLAEISNLSNIDVVIATHSADIIYDKWNLTVELQGPSA